MAAINDLIARIQKPDLRTLIEKEVKNLTKQKKFGLVFENHIPEMTLLYDYPISRGCKVISKSDDDKKLAEDILWEVKKINKNKATCVHTITNEEHVFNISDLISVAKNGEPIYPCLKYVDSVLNAPNSDLWHTLIEADNYHALQLLAYLYPGMVDCIYIDPPYNTGDKSWKYNNNYVDGNDSYRHSKWLAMMKSRLLLAKKLLNPDNSVLIVTIDEKEYLHLGCLLEEIFPEAEGDKENNYKGRVSIQMVSDIIHPSGVARENQFARVEEYIFYVFIGSARPCKSSESMLDFEMTGNYQNSAGGTITWRRMIRAGSNSNRERSENCFYPIFIDKKTNKIHSVGVPPGKGVNRDLTEVPKGCVALWPLHSDGSEGVWQISSTNLKEALRNGTARLGKPNRQGGWAMNYLNEGMLKEIEKGSIAVKGKDENGALILERASDKLLSAKSVWNKKLHDATQYGTYFLNDLFCGKRFSYPKSIYAVHDTLKFFVADKPDALILDFFAGSGTTLHAVNLLNKEDGGHRRCIMVTNNEVSADEESAFRAKGLHKGDEEWEKFGIARFVNWPRTKCSIMGVDINGQPLNDEYITSITHEKVIKRTIKQLSFDIPDNKQSIKVKKQIVALINDKKMPQNSVTAECPYIVREGASNAIIFNLKRIDEFFDEIHDKIENIYVVTDNNKDFNAAKHILDELPEMTKTIPVTIPMSEGFYANAAFYNLTFLDKEAISIGTQLDKLLSILWMKAGAYGICPTHVEGEYSIFPQNRMAILIDEYGVDELKAEIVEHPEIETVYIIDDSEENYRALAAQMNVKNTYQLYRDYLDNFKINVERR